MTPVYIQACGGYASAVGDQPEPLKPILEASGGRIARRTNRFIDLALIGAIRCVQGRPLPQRCGIYIATGQGDVADCAVLVEQMVRDHMPPMPFRFINVSCNTAGFHVARQLGLELTTNQMVSTQGFPTEAALRIAMLDLHAGRHEAALVGAVDECAWPLEEHRRRLGLPEATLLGEGSHWLLLTTDAQGAMARIDEVAWPLSRAAIGAKPEAAIRRGRAVATGRDIPSWLQAAPHDPDSVGYFDTNTGHTFVQFLQTAAPGDRLCHIDGGTDDAFARIKLTAL